MGCGKTSMGKPLARKLGYQFIDLDHHIEQCEGLSIPEIFAQNGEQHFRELENRYLAECLKTDEIVISTGGGTPCFNGNMELMNSAGTTIYLRMEPTALVCRLINAHTVRPLVAGKSSDELLDYITQTLGQREFYYNQSDITIDNPSRNIDKIVEIISYL